MTKQIIGIGAENDDKNGDPLRTAFTKINDNFTELYGFTSNNVFYQSQVNVQITGGNVTHGNITLNAAQGTYFYCNLTSNVGNVIASNLATSSTAVTYNIEFQATPAPGKTVTFPSYWRWQGGTPPTITTTDGKIDLITVTTRNTGSGNLWLARINQNF